MQYNAKRLNRVLGLLFVSLILASGALQAQPGYSHLLVRVYCTDNKLIEFKKWDNRPQIQVCYSSKKCKRGFSHNIVSSSASEYGAVRFNRIDEFVKLTIKYNSQTMEIAFKNLPNDKTLNLLINKIYFKPGVYELDCLKTKNEMVNDPLFGTCWDITPSYWND